MSDLEQSYRVLGIGSNAGPSEIKRAYRDLVKVWHPDRFPGEPRLQEKAQEQLKKINLAYRKIMSQEAESPGAAHNRPGPSATGASGARSQKTYARPGRRSLAMYLGVWLAILIACGLVYPFIKTDLAEIPYNLGSAYFQSGHYGEALTMIRLSHRLNPTARTCARLGETQYRLAKYPEAKEAFTQALRMNPSDLNACFGLAATYGRLGATGLEMETYRQALRIRPDSPEAYLNLGKACERNGNYKEAETAYNRALRIDPQSQQAEHGLALVCGRLGRHREAVQALKRAIEIGPANPELYNDLGAMYNKLGLSGQELDAYRKAIEKDPSSKEAHYNFALANIRTGSIAQAQKELETLQELDPSLAFELYRKLNQR